MRAVVCETFGGPEVLRLRELPDPPPPGAGEVQVRIAARGVQYTDVLLTAGKYQTKKEPPFIPGSEAAGEIVGVGDGLDLAAVVFEDLAERFEGQGGVVDDQDARIHGARSLRRSHSRDRSDPWTGASGSAIVGRGAAPAKQTSRLSRADGASSPPGRAMLGSRGRGSPETRPSSP